MLQRAITSFHDESDPFGRPKADQAVEHYDVVVVELAQLPEKRRELVQRKEEQK